MKSMIAIVLTLLIALPAAQAGRKASVVRPARARASLQAVLDVERQSQAYYLAVLNRHRPIHPFGMVYRVEVRHEQALVDQYRKLGIPVKDTEDESSIEVPAERDKALASAVEMEKKTIAAYDTALKYAKNPELRETLERLRSDSADHEKWFTDPDSCPGGGRGPGPRGRGA